MGVASSHLSLKGGGGGGSSAQLGQAGVGVPYPASSREFSPSLEPGQPQGPRTCSRSASTRILGAQMLFGASGCSMAFTLLLVLGAAGQDPSPQ